MELSKKKPNRFRFLRPDDLIVSANSTAHAIAASVKSVKYFGSFVELLVVSEGGIGFLLHTSQTNWKVADRAFLSYKTI